MDVDDNFYDEIASLMRPSDDYTFNDLDEIIGSTVSNLDNSLGLGTFGGNDFPLSDSIDSSHLPLQHNEFGNFNLSAFPSPATTLESATPPYATQRTPSTSSVDGDFFNPDEFMNFLNDDDIKLEEFPSETLLDDSSMQQRNTPSPTGSCSSSGCSSTSGIQSDASSVSSDVKQLYDQDVECGMASLERSFKIELPQSPMTPALSPAIVQPTQLMTVNDNPKKITTPALTTNITTATNTTTIVPITIPVLPLQAAQVPPAGGATVLQTLPQVAALNVVQGAVLPIQTVPITNLQTSATTTTNNATAVKKPIPVKVEPKIAPKNATPTLKILSSATPAPNSTTTTPTANGTSTGKITPPTNAKPKTIFLSSNDFKALMQKMNTNGKAGAKISGSVSSQMPKIIMKGPNGKIITTNKFGQQVTSANVGQQHSNSLTSKIIKTNSGPLLVKQQQQQPGAKFITSTRAGAINTIKMNAINSSGSSSSSSHTPDLSIYKGILDEKMLKKQQRMIKNRESASLSRKKKKEYVVSLETRISNLEKENSTLKGENTTLRSQLMAFAQTCHCRNGNVSEFVLNSLNIKLNGEPQHVKIAPKPASKNFKQRMSAANVKKNVAVLFAMAFMVTMNVGNFQNYLNKNSIENAVVEAPEETLTASGGRRLLWVETEGEFNKKLNRTKREIEMDVPPLHFIKPVGRNNGSTQQEQDRYAKADEPPILSNGTKAKCANQTEEYLRLASNLHKWIDGNDYLNLSMHDKYDNDEMTRQLKSGFKLTKDYEFDMNAIRLPGTMANGKRKLYLNAAATEYERKQRKLEAATKLNNEATIEKNSLDLFKPKISEEYLRLFKGIKRQEDTFYVLSFNMDHILLPASAYNKSARPKMSLLLPAGDPSLNGDIVLMQIDCEVINTTELALKLDMIPEKLRPSKFGGNFHATTATPQANDVANNETGAHAARNAKADAKLDILPAASGNTTTAAPMPAPTTKKEKPTVRTYMLVGPKTQEAAAAAKKQPTIVRISPNDSRLLHVKNSTLFAKMRDTIAGDVGP